MEATLASFLGTWLTQLGSVVMRLALARIAVNMQAQLLQGIPMGKHAAETCKCHEAADTAYT